MERGGDKDLCLGKQCKTRAVIGCCCNTTYIDYVLLENTVRALLVTADDKLMALGLEPVGNAQLSSTKRDQIGISWKMRERAVG